MNKKNYQRRSGQKTSSNRPIISVAISVILIIISIPLAFEALIDWYKYIPVIVLFLVVTIFLGKQAYQGLVNRHVKIFPQSSLKINEVGYSGGKSSNYVTGTAAQIAGVLCLIMGTISFGMVMKYIIALLNTFF